MAAICEWQNTAKELEQQELEAPGGIASAEVYSNLLGCYLHENDLVNAKLLWKRIPSSVKSSCIHLSHLWEIGKQMWEQDWSLAYKAIDRDWPDNLKPMLRSIRESLQTRAVFVISNTYSMISANNLSALLGMPEEEAVKAAVTYGWTADSETKMVTPVKADKTENVFIPNEKQLARLTDYVSFLEN